MVKQQHKQFKRKKSVIWGLVIFEVIGWRDSLLVEMR